MGIGAGVLLMAVGAILAFGVNFAVPHANLQMIGIILMAVGALGLIISLVLLAPRRGGGPPLYDERTYRDRGRY